MFSNLKKKVTQRRRPSPLPPTSSSMLTSSSNNSHHQAVTVSERSTASAAHASESSSTMKIHIQIRFRPEWNLTNIVLSTLQKYGVDVLLHKSSPMDKEWHQLDLYGKLALLETDGMNKAQQMENLKLALTEAIHQPEAIIQLKQWEPRIRRQKMQSVPVGVGNGLFGEKVENTAAAAAAAATETSPMHPPPKKQWGVPAKIVLQDEHGKDIVHHVRLSSQSVLDLHQGGGNQKDYHGYPLKQNGKPICLLTAQLVETEDTQDDAAEKGRLHGLVRKPSM